MLEYIAKPVRSGGFTILEVTNGAPRMIARCHDRDDALAIVAALERSRTAP